MTTQPTPPEVPADGLMEFTVSAEVAALMMAKRPRGMSIAPAPLPAPVPASQHASIMESKTHPNVVWPL